jgi:hypothetical protein
LAILLFVDMIPGHTVVWWWRLVRLSFQPLRYLMALFSGCILRPAAVNARAIMSRWVFNKPRAFMAFFSREEVRFPAPVVLPRPRRPNMSAIWHCCVGGAYLAWSYVLVMIGLTYAVKPVLSAVDVAAVFVCS